MVSMGDSSHGIAAMWAFGMWQQLNATHVLPVGEAATTISVFHPV